MTALISPRRMRELSTNESYQLRRQGDPGTRDHPLILIPERICLPGFSFYNLAVALVVFLRGMNVGGHRTFRPSVLAKKLRQYDVLNVGAAGTFIVRKPGPRAKFRAALLSKLPFEAEVFLCDGRDLIRLELENPFQGKPSPSDIVRFVSVLSKAAGDVTSIPYSLPPTGDWFVRVIASQNRFVFGEYRRHMKTISYLGQMDKLFGAAATTRNWNTISAIVRILKGEDKKGGHG